MKILIVSHSAVVALYREKYHLMAGQGHEIHLLLPRCWPEGSRTIEAPETGEEAGVVIHRLEGGFYGHVSLFYLKQLATYIDLINPDLIHAEEEPRSVISWQLMNLAKKRSLPFSFFTWENIARHYKPPFNLINAMVLKKAGCAIAGNREGLNVLKKRKYKGSIIVMPQYGIDPDRFKPGLKKNRSEKDKFVVGYLGRLLPEKGIITIINAIEMVSDKIILHIIGAGSYRRKLEKKVQKQGLVKRVIFSDAIDNDKIPMTLNQLDAVVLPSLTTKNWKEQFGRILIEAMACEVPVIGTDSGEIPFVMGKAGLIFKEGNAKVLSEHIMFLANHPQEADKLGQAGRRRVMENYTTKLIALKTIEIFNNIISRWQRP